MKWFKRMITRWAHQDQDYTDEKYANIRLSGNAVSTPGPFRSVGADIDSHAGLNITVIPAIGGKIITFRHYDRRKDDNQYRHYVIPDDLDFERELGKMITLESIRQG
jgi:hypothetical protein